MHYDAVVYWNKGAISEINQDSLVLMQALTSKGRVLLAAVCDGMGELGECASGYLTKEFTTWFEDGLLDALCKKNPVCAIRRFVERKVYRIQCRMHEYAENCGQEMGTTLSMLIIWEKKYMLWHLGESRIYRFFQCKKAKIRTKARGNMKDLENMFELENVNELEEPTKYIGSVGFFLPDFETGTIRSGDAFLLCSDAFIRRITLEEIVGVLTPKKMTEEVCKRRLREIGEAAMRRGERDNMSAVYVRASAHKKRDRRSIKEWVKYLWTMLKFWQENMSCKSRLEKEDAA
ncbi:MAG: hypothetical protein K2K21_09330 [Lachnospiraceae bacterium]|nr:hypothetical protein [Lachnospiraceae bacterium]